MTNLQADQPPVRWTRERVLVGAPILVGALVALATAGLAIAPLWQAVQAQQERLTLLRELQANLPLLRAQLAQSERRQQQEITRQATLLSLIAGSGSIATFLAQLSTIAAETGVQLDGFEPVVAVAPDDAAKTNPARPATPAPADPKAAAEAKDPLLMPGLEATKVILKARGTGPQLLGFLRRLEQLSLLVVQSDLQLKLETLQGEEQKRRAPLVELSLNLALYAKAPAQPKAAAAPPKP